MGAGHTAVLAALIRALVETAARQWEAGVPPVAVSASVLRAWTWQASRTGVEGQLIIPATGSPAPAGDVVAQLLETVRPVLVEYQEEEQVEVVITEILREGTGARRQREAYRHRGDVREVVRQAIEAAHHAPEAWATTSADPTPTN